MIEGLTLAEWTGAAPGVPWSVWQVIGWLGNVFFFTRFAIQWYATERRQQVVVPVAFWWLSLSGCLCLLAYALFGKRDPIFICANAVSWIPYVRNLVIHRRSQRAVRVCQCGAPVPAAEALFCSHCGSRLPG